MSQSVCTALTLGGIEIRQHDGLFSLNDLHAASGGEPKHQPAFFLRNEQTKALIAEIASSANSQTLNTVEGRNGGTYACREVVIAYAAWITAAFHLKVIRVFLATTAPVPAEQQPPSLLNRRWLISYDHRGREQVQAVPADAMVVTLDELTREVSTEGGLMVSSAELANLAAACTKSLAARLKTPAAPSDFRLLTNAIGTAVAGAASVSETARRLGIHETTAQKMIGKLRLEGLL